MVGIWFERTMEKARNYTVTSYPAVADTDADTLTNFSEFTNGSDPRAIDTDGEYSHAPAWGSTGTSVGGV